MKTGLPCPLVCRCPSGTREFWMRRQFGHCQADRTTGEAVSAYSFVAGRLNPKKTSPQASALSLHPIHPTLVAVKGATETILTQAAGKTLCHLTTTTPTI